MKFFQKSVNTTKIKLERHSNKHLNVVVTGGSRGLGKALCRRFLHEGDRVVMICRNPQNVEHHDNLLVVKKGVADITRNVFDCKVDLWINNAAVSHGYKRFLDHSDNNVREIFETNLIGAALCSKQAFEIMTTQSEGGAIFNISGAGSNGFSTPAFSLYGASKAGLVQLTRSLQAEWKDTNVNIHTVSPGMMKTDLLMENLPPSVSKMVSYFCTDPDIVAEWLVGEMKKTYYSAQESAFIQYTSLSRVMKMAVHQK